MTDFKNKVVLVTGATSGIGRATALHFADLGARLVAAARNADNGDALVEDLAALGAEASFVVTDVTLEDQVAAMVDHAVNTFGQLDYAFNNAGIFIPEPPIENHDTETWQSVISSNLTSVYTCMKHEIRVMLKHPAGDARQCAIINNASIIGHRGSLNSGLAYTTAKHGVIGLTRQTAISSTGTGIRVNAVSPGPTLTAATAASLDDSDETRARIATLNPTGELVPAEEIARTVAFLCSDAALMINGHDIPLDGGQLAKL